MNALDALNNLRQAVRRGIPDTVIGKPVRSALDTSLDRISFKLDADEMCEFGRALQHLVAGVALLTPWEGDDGVAPLIDEVLDWAGCDD